MALKAPQKSLKDWGDQTAFVIPLHGRCQTPLQLRGGCTLEPAMQRTLHAESHVLDDVPTQGVVHSTHDEHRHVPHYPEQKPIEGLMPRCSFGRRRCDRPAEDCLGFDEKRQLPICARTDEHRDLTQREDSLLCARWALVAESAQFGYDVPSFGAAHLTNLSEHFRDRSQSIALLFRKFQSKFLSFRSPVTGS